MNNIQLNYNYGYNWFSEDGIYVKGYLFDSDNKLYSEEKLIEYFKGTHSENEFKNKLVEANGIFSVIINNENNTFLAVDRTRTFPLFYIKNDDNFCISDDTYYLKNQFKCQIDTLSADEYLATGYVTGKDTLLKDVYQVQSGEYIVFNNEIQQNFYFDYITTQVSDKSFEELQEEFLDILDRSINRLIKVADGKQIVLPLSGGYDSRLIASLLKKHKYENVLCFTYGSKESFEVKISQKVAEVLGYKWYFVEYSEETIPSNYPNTEVFQKYYKFASNHVSIFLTQDYFAVKHLVENNIIETDSLIVPGHSGDFLAGSHLAKTEIALPNNIVNVVLKKHYVLKDVDKRIVKQLSSIFNKIYTDPTFYYSVDENFNLKERQSKFIVNANRVYEYFNHHHSVPLWDNELIDFFKSLPLKHKLNSSFYEQVIFNNIFKELEVGYRKSETNPSSLKKKFKILIKKIVPQIIINFLKKKLIIDYNANDMRARPLAKEANIHLSNTIDYIIASWYITKVRDEKNI